MAVGRTVALFSDTGLGKTTQAGELAKDKFKSERKRTLYHGADYGGHESIQPLIDIGVIDADDIGQTDDPWIWLNDAAKGKGLSPEQHGLVVFDSGTSIGEAILNKITKSSEQVGQQKTQRFKVASGDTQLQIGINNEAHYGLVQTFMLDKIWESTWLTRLGVDVLWTFGIHRGESVEAEPIIGPKLVGKALTPQIPKWFNYTFRLDMVPPAPGSGADPEHILILKPQVGVSGALSFGNARYPLAASDSLPAVIKPASIVEAFNLIEKGRQSAADNLRAELGL